MRCYRHRDAEAVGVCGGCMKGVCDACGASTPGGLLSCCEACARRIEENEQLRGRLATARQQQRFNVWLGPGLHIVLGALFLGYGIERYGPELGLVTMLGAAFMGYGVLLGWRVWKWSRQQLQ